MITDVEDRTDTAVVIAVFGTDRARVQANTEGIRKQLKQDLYADVYLAELLVDGAKSVYPQDVLSKVRHLTVQTTEACLDLFQKEALLNYGWRAALAHHPYDYFIFTDADVYSPETSWFRHIRGRLRQNPARAVQGWRTARDTVDAQFALTFGARRDGWRCQSCGCLRNPPSLILRTIPPLSSPNSRHESKTR